MTTLEWKAVAQELGVVLARVQDELTDMCRRSIHDAEITAALSRLSGMFDRETSPRTMGTDDRRQALTELYRDETKLV